MWLSASVPCKALPMISCSSGKLMVFVSLVYSFAYAISIVRDLPQSHKNYDELQLILQELAQCPSVETSQSTRVLIIP